ncbi:MAG: hypothetical protein IT422_05385 [Pirellulaceae bacterium]|jgi:hypothetical protein|nr:hypothetical protein [Pirellulaceae bacterium]
MFYAARSGKQHLALECLENRHLLSADFGAVDLHIDLAKQAPAPAIVAIAPTAQMSGQVDPFGESKSRVTAKYKDHPSQHLANHFGTFESGDSGTDDVDPDDYDRLPQQVVFVAAIRSAQIMRSELPHTNAPKWIIELEIFKVTTVQRVVVIDYHQDDGGEGEGEGGADDFEIDTSSLHGVRESPVAVAIKTSSPNLVATSNHSVSNSTARFAMPIETAATQADESVASEQNATNLEIKSDRGRQPTNSPLVGSANPIQQPITPSLRKLEPVTDSNVSNSRFDAPLAEGARSAADSAVAIGADEGPVQHQSSAAIASVQDLVTDLTARVVPAARELFSAGLSGDYQAIDMAMSQLLYDLDSVRTEATLLLDESTLRGLASTAVVGVIAAEIVRRRMREKVRVDQDSIEEHLAIWMYPECSGVSGRPSL